MKKGTFRIFAMLYLFMACLIAGTELVAQSPQKISYQAAVRNAADLLITNTSLGIKISILQGDPVSGTVVYSETHIASTNANGIVTLEIGTGNIGAGPLLSTIDWEAGPYFIKTETDPLGGTTYTIEGTTQLTSVPFVFYTPTAGNSFDGDYNSLTNAPLTDGSETKINAGTFISVTGVGSTPDPYIINSNQVIGGYSHYLGEYYSGGIIFYLYKRSDGTERALVAHLSESTEVLEDPTSNTGATSLWDGAGNTAKYVANSPAATYVSGLGYGWYIPSIDELNLMWQNRYHVNSGLAAVGGTPLSDNNIYWSSTESSASTNLAYNFDFANGAVSNAYSKSNPGGFKVRAVRWLTTPPSQITTTAASSITNASASSGGNIQNDEGSLVTARGVCWSTSPNPTTADSKTVDGAGMGSFTSSITGLTNNTIYYVRAFATNGSGTAYGDEKTFTTASTAPVVTTTAASDLTKISATSGGNVTDERGEAVTARGVCWSTSPNPTLSDSFSSDGPGGGVFTSSITGLVTGTLYYVRAYATNSVGTSYGNQVTFTSLAVPTLTTTATAYTSAGNGTSGGDVTNDGGASVTARGVCWSTSSNPTTADNTTADGSGSGIFTSSLSGLTLGTTYYVRAYAISAEGTGYGNQIAITTLAIGDSYLGGKVGYLDGTGLHGLVVSLADLNGGANTKYSNITASLCGAASTTDGQANTNAIISQPGYDGLGAATYCDTYSNGGNSNWYLPARDQWTSIWPNRVALGIGGTLYWTSSEFIASQARRLNSGAFDNQFKTNTYRVRAVSTF